MNKHHLKFLTSAAIMALALAQPDTGRATEAPVSDESTDRPAVDTSDITVTARFRSERLQDVPIAISAIGRDQLASSHNDTLRQIQQQIPSLQILGFNPRNVSITIRGLGTNAGVTNDGLEQGVGIYVDDVYQARPSIAVTDMVDIDHIDVLRGPQGTLFGKNSTAGAISVNTGQPTFDRDIRLEGTVGNYGFRQGKVVVSDKITDTLAGRFAAWGTHRDGYLYNTHYGQDWDTYNNYGFRGQLLFKPSDSFSLRLSGDYNRQSGQGGIYVAKQVLSPTLANGSTIRSFYQRSADAGYTPLPIDPFARRVDLDTSQAYRLIIGGLSAKAELTLPSGFRLTSISAYRKYVWDPSLDGDFIGIPIMTQGNIPTRQQQFTQELRLSSPGGGKVDYTAGLFYFWQKAHSDYYLTYGSAASAWLLGPTAPSAILDKFSSYANYTPVTKSYSGFGQVTWHAADRLDLTLGARYTYEQKHGTYTGYAIGSYAAIADLPTAWQATAAAYRNAIAPTLTYDASVNGGNWSGTANATYKVNRDVLAYASYSRGFKSAGINFANVLTPSQRIVAPETVDSFEIGIKSSLFNRRLTLNTALFWTIDANYQGTNVDAAKGLSYLSNVGKVRSRGVEWEASVRVSQGLRASFSGTYTDAIYVSFPSSTCPFYYSYQTSCDISGQRLAGVSRWALSGAVDYERPINGRLTGFAGINGSYRSSYFSALNDDPYTLVPGYALFGGQIGVRGADDDWQLSFWARNLFNKNYYNMLQVYTTTEVVNASLGEPRTFGATFKVKY